ncbi:something about silencing protein 10 [Malassezia yamatoensis]|uniref:Something about silencing protein 10 n=1 Tax=Malassezia yamatoensis TaxID=253288 RepID=A0AAJ5YSV6_9BASI|nr:something about silencing protein 10 [Malassezia yamatoensis]
MARSKAGREPASRPRRANDRLGNRNEIPLSDAEQFDAARDKILLDDSQMDSDEEEDFGANDREVLSFDQGAGSSGDDDDGEVASGDSEDDLPEESDAEHDEEDDYHRNFSESDSSRYRSMQIPEEILDQVKRRAPRDDARNSDDEQSSGSSDDDEEGWGTKKHAYYNANRTQVSDSDSELDEDQLRELETKEAIRLQRQSRAQMGDEDFGLGEIDAEEAHANADEQSAAARARRKKEFDQDSIVRESVESATPDELLAKLQVRAPIVLALVDEFQDTLKQLPEVKEYLDSVSSNGERSIAEIAHLYYQTLSGYVMLLCYFFQLASTAEAAAKPESLLEHPLMDRLSQFKKALVEMKALGLFDPDDASSNDDREMAGIMGPPTEEDLEYEQLGDLEPGELENLIQDEKENQHSYEPLAEPVKSEKQVQQKKKRAKKRGDTPAAPAPANPLAAVASVTADLPHASRRNIKDSTLDADAYGEPLHMRSSDAEEKMHRKRLTQFHADAMADASTAKSRKKLEGDEDIPYRDRKRSREAVAAANMNKLGKTLQKPVNHQLTNSEWGEADWDDREAVMESENSSGGRSEKRDDDLDQGAAYYDLISSNRQSKKHKKKEDYDHQRLASRVYDQDDVAPGEHRVIDRTIEKNKGLTPHRPKSIRNPRVKRRMKYDRANKRLSSTRAVYKGGQSALQGGYQGEKSGISVNLVKSRKLGS